MGKYRTGAEPKAPVISTILTGEDLEEQVYQAVENEINSVLRMLNVKGEINDIRCTEP